MARFRADPEMVRIRIRFNNANKLWHVTISPKEAEFPFYMTGDENPENAVMQALELANDEGLEGIDLSMGYAYDHPMKINS